MIEKYTGCAEEPTDESPLWNIQAVLKIAVIILPTQVRELPFIVFEPFTAMRFQGFIPEEAVRKSISLAIHILENWKVPAGPDLKLQRQVLSSSCLKAQD